MKKFMFTAIAMIAFVGSSLANAIELKDIEFATDGEVVLNVCDDMGNTAWNQAKEEGLSDEAAGDKMTIAYQRCIALHEELNLKLE